VRQKKDGALSELVTGTGEELNLWCSDGDVTLRVTAISSILESHLARHQ